MNNKDKNVWRLLLINVGLFLIFIVLGVFLTYYIPNKAVELNEQIITAKSEVEFQENERINILINLVKCVKDYDEKEYQSLMDLIEREKDSKDVLSVRIKIKLDDLSKIYPELKEQDNYNRLLKELSVIEDIIVQDRNDYNLKVAQYNSYCERFPNLFFLNLAAYEKQSHVILGYAVQSETPIVILD